MDFNWFDHLFAFLIIIVIPALSLKSDKMSEEVIQSLPLKKHLFFSNGLMLIISALLVITSWNISNREWSGMGFSLVDFNIKVIYLCIIIITFYLADIFFGAINKEYDKNKLENLKFIIPLNWKEYRSYIFLAISAGICEEIIFRGFLISYLYHFLSWMDYGNYISVAIPSIIFSLSHLYQGWWAVVKIMFIALILGFIFLYSGSLIPVIIIHIFIDLTSGAAAVIASENE